MEEAKGVVKHVVLAKFKDGIAENKIEEIIKGFANLVNLIEPMKSFNWGKDVSSENLHQGFTHIFESTFESTEGVAEYVAHPAHVDFANLFLSHLEKVIAIDYKPTAILLDWIGQLIVLQACDTEEMEANFEIARMERSNSFNLDKTWKLTVLSYLNTYLESYEISNAILSTKHALEELVSE